MMKVILNYDNQLYYLLLTKDQLRLLEWLDNNLFFSRGTEVEVIEQIDFQEI